MTGIRRPRHAYVRASWRLLKQDRQLLLLPLAGSIAALVAAAILFVPGWALGDAVTGHRSTALWVGGVLAAGAASIMSIYFQAALVIGANQRAEGGAPTLRGVLAQAWQFRRQIFAWAVLSTTVGVAVRTLEQRLGVIGKLVGFLGGLAWAIASFLAVPVLVAEGLGPVAAVKRSGQLVRQTWGTSLRTTLRFGLVQLVIIVPVVLAIVGGAVAFGAGSTGGAVAGGVILVVAVAAFIALVAIFGAVSTYAQAMIYRYATGRPAPGLPDGLLGGAFMQKRSRWR